MQNTKDKFISIAILKMKSDLIRKVRGKYKPGTNDKDKFRFRVISSLKILEKNNIDFRYYPEEIIKELFYPNSLTSFFTGCNENQGFLSLITPLLIFALSLMVAKAR